MWRELEKHPFMTLNLFPVPLWHISPSHHVWELLQEWKNNMIIMFRSTRGKFVHSKITKFRKEPTSFYMLIVALDVLFLMRKRRLKTVQIWQLGLKTRFHRISVFAIAPVFMEIFPSLWSGKGLINVTFKIGMLCI